MPSSIAALPSVMEGRRILTLVASVLVSLASGTNYVISAYAPQLASRLHISHTRLNVIALAGNVGVYLSSPLWGMTVDRHGPKPPLFTAFALLMIGYSGIRIVYDTGVPSSTKSIPTPIFLLLVIFSFMTGVGGNGGFSASLNATTKTFPDSMRGSTVGLVVSGFGLSAFIFSFIARHAFPGETSLLLLTLALGTALPMLFGLLVVRPIPLPPSEPIHEEPNSRTPLLSQDDTTSDARQHNSDSGIRSSRRRNSKLQLRKALLDHIYGRNLFTSLDFWILFCNFSLISGTGLMYINNVGSMAQVLYLHEHPGTYDEIEVSQWQAMQVSTISILSFLGRIFIGLLSDFAKAHFALPRSHLLILVATTALASQIVASQIDMVSHLWISSALLGFGYGMLFSLSTSICFEWFGLAHFSETVGFLTVSPLIGGNIFSVAFGRNLDAHESPATPQTFFPLVEEPSVRQCQDGRVCYVGTLYLTTAACAVTVLLSVWAGWRDHKRIQVALIEEERDLEHSARSEPRQS